MENYVSPWQKINFDKFPKDMKAVILYVKLSNAVELYEIRCEKMVHPSRHITSKGRRINVDAT